MTDWAADTARWLSALAFADPAWSYKLALGGVTAILFLVLAVVVPAAVMAGRR
jgi:hypothetical protein